MYVSHIWDILGQIVDLFFFNDFQVLSLEAQLADSFFDSRWNVFTA